MTDKELLRYKKTVSKQLLKLRDFLVPENCPNKLVKNWNNYSEDINGDYGANFKPVRFCIIGGARFLYNESKAHESTLATIIINNTNYTKFNFSCKHTANTVYKFLTRLSQRAINDPKFII